MTSRLLSCFLVVAAGCVDLEHQEVGTTSGEVAVTWTNLVGVSASGNDLTKTAGTSAWDAGAVSVETLVSDGFVELTVGAVGNRVAAGLSNGDGGQSFADIDFAIRLGAGGAVQVVEGGTLVGSFGTFDAGDRFRVEADNGVVTYSRSGEAPFYTSTVAPSFPLGVDTAFYTPGATISDVELVATGLTWQNVVGVSASGDTITKTAGTDGYNAGASSVQTLGGDGFLDFAVADNTTAKAAGLSNGDSDQSYADIDFALQLTKAGVVRVSEGGVVRGSFGTYLGGDRFRVEVSGGVVSYSRNGGPAFYTSAVPASVPLGVDTSLSTPGATITDLALVEAVAACPAYDGTGLVCSGSFTILNSVDVAEIAGCVSITGNLTISGAAGMTEIALPALERIGGALSADNNPDLARLRLPALREIGGTTNIEALATATRIDVSGLRTSGNISTLTSDSVDLAFPCLDTSGTLDATEWNGSATVGAPLHVPRLRQIDGNFKAGNVTAPALTTVSGNIGTASVPELATLDAPGLTTIGGTFFYHPEHDLPSLVEIAQSLIAVGPTSDCGGPTGSDVLSLPSLERVGALRLCSSAYQQVSLPSLQIVTGPSLDGDGLFISSSSVTDAIELPALSSVEGTAYSGGPIDLPALTEVSGDFISWGPVSAPVLASVEDSVSLRGAASYSLPSLTSAGSVLCLSWQAISIDLPALTQVRTKIDMRGCNGLTSISMPVLASIPVSLRIQRNVELTSLDFGSLTSLGDTLTIKGNSSLPNCYATDIHEQLLANGWTGTATISGNNGTGTCP